MTSRQLATVLGAIYLALLIVVLQFGHIIGEGRVIDVVIEGIAQAVRS